MNRSNIVPIGSFTEGAHGKRIPGSAAPAPCPFCGLSDMVEVFELGDEDDDLTYHAQCSNCGSEGPSMGTFLAAADAWNTRPEPHQARSKPRRR